MMIAYKHYGYVNISSENHVTIAMNERFVLVDVNQERNMTVATERKDSV
jgi:hypothetical protein